MNEVSAVLSYYGLLPENHHAWGYAKIECPFHSEGFPSLYFDFEKKIFNCFGCGAKGSLIDFVSKMEGFNGIKAISKLNHILKKRTIKPIIPEYKTNRKELLDKARFYFNSIPHIEWRDIKEHYLFERGFEPETLNWFNVKINADDKYPIIIPITENRKFKGYVCRSIEDVEDKYRYNLGFKRNNVLFGNYDCERVIVVEGVLDVMKLWQFKEFRAVSTLGWNVTEKQLRKLEIAKVIITALDNDEKGKEGNRKIIEYFEGNVFEFYYGKRKDMCELTRKEYKKKLQKTFLRG